MTIRPVFVEYIWIDGYNSLRSKNRVLNLTTFNLLNEEFIDQIPMWNYDGSSTNQATTESSEVLLKPVRVYTDPFTPNNVLGLLVMCETLNVDGTPHPSNNRQFAMKSFENAKYDDTEYWFGLEQEFFLFDIHSNKPMGFPQSHLFNPEPQGKYYCSVGGEYAYGRGIVQKAYMLAHNAGINISGMNGEVAPGQWEIQVGISKGLKAGDDLWMLRYILNRVAEMSGNVRVEFHAKPVLDNRYHFDQRWNGSGLHTNFSTPLTRHELVGYNNILAIINRLSKHHNEHMKLYGKDNELRLTGKLETSNINEFSHSVGGRNTSIRIPNQVEMERRGYFEDRRPSSSADPYLIISVLVECA